MRRPSNSQSVESVHGDRIAYRVIQGRAPTVMFCGGYMSDMSGTKATALEAWAKACGQAYLRFDYSGHGVSSGRFRDGTISRWTDDALAVVDHAVDGPVVVVGSSMGGWIALNIALQRPERIVGLVGIAAAPDFTEWAWRDFLDEEQRRTIRDKGYVKIPSEYGDEPYIFTRDFFDDAKTQFLLDRGEIPISCPVRLIQGERDREVPADTPAKISARVRSEDVEVTLIKAGDHRLSSDRDLERLISILDRLLGDLCK